MDDLQQSNDCLSNCTEGNPNNSGLHPVPIPEELYLLPPEQAWSCLLTTEPIDGPEHLALHVAQLTLCLAMLKERLEALENDRSDRERNRGFGRAEFGL